MLLHILSSACSIDCIESFVIRLIVVFAYTFVVSRAIYAIAFQKRDVVVLRKTGEGKTLISLAVSLLRRGVSVFMVPLVALGVDLIFYTAYCCIHLHIRRLSAVSRFTPQVEFASIASSILSPHPPLPR